MVKFREWLREAELNEAKQVGTIYHFTKPKSIYMVLNKNNQKEYGLEILEFFSHNGNFSTTRNSSMTSDFSHPVLSIRNEYIVRLALDGDKLSNKYKIKPVLGLQDNSFDLFNNISSRVPRKWGENEEVVLGNTKLKDESTFKLKDYLIQIDIYNRKEQESNDLKEIIELLLKESGLNVPVNIVRHFVNIKNTNKVKLNESADILQCEYLELIKKD